MPGSLSQIKGTGYPDYRRRSYGTQAVRVLGGSVDISGTIEHINAVGTLNYAGTLGRVRLVGSLGHVTVVGSLARVGRVGTVGQVGTVRYIQAGSLGQITNVGSLARVGRVGTLQRVGTVRYIQAGSLGYIGRVGTLVNQPRVGTLGRVGTVRYLQAGSLGRVERIGTIGQLGRVGTAHPGTVPTEIFSRRGVYSTIRGNVRLGAGSIWLGSWQHVGSYELKTFLFNVGNQGTTGGGSVAILTGLQGTGATGGIGTYFGPVRVGKGSYTPLSFTEAVRYARPWIRQHGAGAVPQHGGTVSFHLGVRP